MSLIDHWQKAHRLFSVQVAIIGVVFWSALGGLWIMWPLFAERLPIPVYIGVWCCCPLASALADTFARTGRREGRNYTVVHLPFDSPKVYTVCGGITNYDVPTLKLGQKFTGAECNKLIAGIIPRYAAPLQACIPSFTSMPPHR
jgi:hypothetical protein